MSEPTQDKQRTLPGVTMIVCRRGARPRAAPCDLAGCNREHTKLCDFPLRGKRAGATCDAKICDAHATQVGPGRDYCPAHARMKGNEP